MELLVCLQKLEAGLINYIPQQLLEITRKGDACGICNENIMVNHHILTYSKKRIVGDSRGEANMVGEVAICPNCHARIHTFNPQMGYTNWNPRRQIPWGYSVNPYVIRLYEKAHPCR